VEGGTWINGRHIRPATFAADCEKYNAAAIIGWRVIRVTNHQVESGQALLWIEQLLQSG
jgi:very-short-patch-repair endonuclease